MTATDTPGEAVVLTIVCTDDDPRSFCRHLTGAVASTPWVLARAFAVARQVHPQHPDAVGTLATLMHCEFRLRHDGESPSDDEVQVLLTHLDGFETFGLQRMPTAASPVLPTLRP